jgi:hypothetical protein
MPELSEILSAVRPGARTAQCQILAALYALNADRTPVTAREITKLLKLHVGKKAPSNVNDAVVTTVDHFGGCSFKFTERQLLLVHPEASVLDREW